MVASRYVKSSDWDSATDLLYGGALALLRAGQGGSGGDLGCYLVDVLDKAEKGCGAGEKGACDPDVMEANKRRRDPAMGGMQKLLQVLWSADLRLRYREIVGPVEVVPAQRTYKEEVRVGDGCMEWKSWGISERGSRVAPCSRHIVRGRYTVPARISVCFDSTVILIFLQKASPTTRSAISPLVPKTPLNSLPKSSTNGIPRTSPIPPLSTLQEPSFLTS